MKVKDLRAFLSKYQEDKHYRTDKKYLFSIKLNTGMELNNCSGLIIGDYKDLIITDKSFFDKETYIKISSIKSIMVC